MILLLPSFRGDEENCRSQRYLSCTSFQQNTITVSFLSQKSGEKQPAKKYLDFIDILLEAKVSAFAVWFDFHVVICFPSGRVRCWYD